MVGDKEQVLEFADALKAAFPKIPLAVHMYPHYAQIAFFDGDNARRSSLTGRHALRTGFSREQQLFHIYVTVMCSAENKTSPRIRALWTQLMFQKIMNCAGRGVKRTDRALALLGLARAPRGLAGRPRRAKSYNHFLTLWKNPTVASRSCRRTSRRSKRAE